MESVLTSALHPTRARIRVDTRALATWALAGAVVLYLAVQGGGYDVVIRNQIGVVVWWIVLVSAAAGVLPAGRLTPVARIALGLFGAFLAFSALATTWSLSSELSLDEVSRVACYLGVLLLGISIHRDREQAVRHTLNAVATAVVIVAGLALLSRLRPALFPAAQQTATFLPGTQGRLGWPLNYWNALAALLGLGVPLLFAIATSARRLWTQALAAAAIPIVVLAGYLTFSRGGALAAAAGVIAFVVLAPERIPKLVTILTAAAGSAALIAGASHRPALEHGLTNAAARHQGATLILPVIIACAGVALAQVGIGLATRHGTPPRWLRITPRRARVVLLAAIVAALAIALAAGAPSRLSHAWRDFKNPSAAALHQNALGRFGTASGNGRYDYYRLIVNAAPDHLLGGQGPGTFQLIWPSHAPYYSYIVNAHSLYFETLSDVGIVGLALLLGFFALVIGAAIRLVTRTRYESRTRAAAVAAACIAFAVSAAFDWVWQVPVLPVAFLLLAACLFAPSTRQAQPPPRRAVRFAVRGGLVVLSLACVLAIGVPLATTTALRRSQAAVASGNTTLALRDARSAARLQPGAASPQLQSALVLELRHEIPDAAAAARRATTDEPTNWRAWLIRSRLEAELGQASSSVEAYRRARSLNPRSPLFRQ